MRDRFLFTEVILKIILVLLYTCFSLIHAKAAPDLLRPWTGVSDPLIMSTTFNRTFAQLPLKAVVKDKRKFWSSDYWPLSKGNINYRWNSPRPRGFNLNSPTREEALHMTRQELASLAPSEKYDLFVGRYDYPLRDRVYKNTSPSTPLWMGICHGWASAALNHNEPLPIDVVNPDGITIPFGSSDVKGLLSYFYAYDHHVQTTHQMGRRCNQKSDDCQEDLNAGAFHIVLANKLGIEGTSFIADMEKTLEVWNHPIYGYTSRIVSSSSPNRSSARGTKQIIRLKTIIDYVFEIKVNSWEPVIGTSWQYFKRKSYDYSLDIGARGEILGGSWHSNDRPDFLWLVGRTKNFDGMLSRLGELIKD